MATTTARSRSPSGYPDPTPINLDRLLSRLEHTVLVEPSPELRKSRYTRAKASANIEYARTLLLNLEHSASSLPSKSKKSALQKDLQTKRELIKQLNQRLYELDQLNDSDTEGSADSEDEEEDNFPSYAPRKATEAGLEVNTGGGDGNEALQNAARGLTNELRRRGGAQDADVTATGNSLFPSKAKTTTGDSSAHTDAVLSNHRSEQESLETSLLDMAKQLKQQSLHFSQTLEGDKSVVDRAVSGLDRNALGMEAAGQRMSTLRRMTEGRGWWDRMKLYAMIFGLWVFAFLIVFIGPKACTQRSIKWQFHETSASREQHTRRCTDTQFTHLISWQFELSPNVLVDPTDLDPARSRFSISWHHRSSLNHSSSDTEAEYDRLRDLARQEAAKRSSCFDRAHQAYEAGDGARAHELSEEGKRHAAQMDAYNRQARDFIFRENNADGRVASDTVDLHGLFVEEAEDVLEERIKAARSQGQTHLHVIVGKGNHSRGHVQKIKPRVEQVCRELGLQYATEENEGRIYVNLQGGKVDGMPPPPQAPSYGGYPGQHGGQQQQQPHGGGHQQHGGQHGGGHQQQNQNDEMEEMVKKGLPKLFRALKSCCVVM
ncbi:DUF1771-domain-containing protein [Bimuria novae-zelandiae CBS 107.79]|uniref:DUF1771-domain-containing protein n=1 Tax=Bimuria novae-zelandiae CBS 107.79 TaxID=1447943 RepID=A0A6A5UN90_9PLEO|nr:DUF1771-domain-containing protein [Bimuria novae-zelandiae CBS 107.79]